MKQLNKYERVQRVRNLGLNTEENILVDEKTKKNIYNRFLEPLNQCSIRTFKRDEIGCPAYPIVTADMAKKLIPELVENGYSILLATPIDPRDCLFAGAAIKRGKNLNIEIADGAGTVRRVTHHSIVDRRYDIQYVDQIEDKLIRQCAEKFKKVSLDNILFEFSWYTKPIGHLKEKFICWEISEC